MSKKDEPTPKKFDAKDLRILKDLFQAPISHSGNKKVRMAAEAYLDQMAYDVIEPDAEAVGICIGMFKEQRTAEIAEKCDYVINKFLDKMLAGLPEKYQVGEANKHWPFKDRAKVKREEVAA